MNHLEYTNGFATAYLDSDGRINVTIGNDWTVKNKFSLVDVGLPVIFQYTDSLVDFLATASVERTNVQLVQIKLLRDVLKEQVVLVYLKRLGFLYGVKVSVVDECVLLTQGSVSLYTPVYHLCGEIRAGLSAVRQHPKLKEYFNKCSLRQMFAAIQMLSGGKAPADVADYVIEELDKVTLVGIEEGRTF